MTASRTLLACAAVSVACFFGITAQAQTIAREPCPEEVANLAQTDRCPDHHHHTPKFDASYEGGATGARVSTTAIDGSDRDTHGDNLGVQFAGSAESYALQDVYSLRSTAFFFIGGGSLGFEGGFGGDAAGGLRLKIGEHHGPFMRLGLRGHMFGNDRLYASQLELPQVQLGYQFMRKQTVFEVAWRTGAMLVGRYNTGEDATQRLGSAFEFGGHVAVHVQPIHVELEHTSIMLDGTRERVDTLNGALCGEAWLIRLCTDARYIRGDSYLPGRVATEAVQAFYGGLTAGIRRDVMPKPPTHRDFEPR